ncbi:MAG: GTP-binding protein [Thermoplasmata archaeon]|nr:MAG: GTP-binding protein [Thermoplasmata archaeon]
MVGLKEFKKKIILLGDGAVGKTSLVRKYVIDKFDDDYLLTVGFKITAKDLQISMNNRVLYLKLQIWDILGQKGFMELHKSSIPGTKGVLFVADITRKETLLSLESYWIPTVHNMVGKVPFIIMANKSDLLDDAEFSEEELKEFAYRYDVPFYLTSAKTGINVDNAFYSLGRRMIEPDGIPLPKSMKHQIIEGEKSEIAVLIDKIIADFCREYGRSEDAMPVLRRQFEIAKLDLSNPTKEAIKTMVYRLAEVEAGFKKKEIAEANRLKRIKWINEVK